MRCGHHAGRAPPWSPARSPSIPRASAPSSGRTPCSSNTRWGARTATSGWPRPRGCRASCYRTARSWSRSPAPSARASRARLPRTRDEVAAIAALLPAGQAFTVLGFAASRDLALSGRLSRFRALHFATHGVSSLDHPELSSLVLSRFDAQGRPRDGYLRAADLAALDLPADLVVLSARGTALGRETPGEGVVGLPQAFFRAGATRVVVTLWPVEEESTAALMAAFYRRLLRDHLPPGRALREAQLAVRGEPRWREARYWAGFVLLGD